MDGTTTFAGRRPIVKGFAEVKGKTTDGVDLAALAGDVGTSIPDNRQRTSEYLPHPVFNPHHSELDLLRCIKSLEAKDLSLWHSMIPLGSCTMKLNATTEMVPVTWARFGGLHPFAPADQTTGYMQLINELNDWLCEITGFAKMSFQPNSGAQG